MLRTTLFSLYDLLLLSGLMAWVWVTGMFRNFLRLASEHVQIGSAGVVDFAAFPIGIGLLCLLAGVGLALRNSNDTKFVSYLFFLASAVLLLLWFVATGEAIGPIDD
ncbi:MAG: hypothetical protein SGJ03_03075 [Alphaproteobacteria bacterium]|nr:hypothetical protein [Alphaproteobacteria bacterium]